MLNLNKIRIKTLKKNNLIVPLCEVSYLRSSKLPKCPLTPRHPDFISGSHRQVPTKYRSTSVEVKNLLKVIDGEMSRKEMQEALELKHEGNFRENYLEPALADTLIEMKYPDSPNHPKQKYLITEKGSEIKKQL